MKKLIIISLLLTTACSHSNVSGKWDCPAQGGYPCITITDADKIAMRGLEEEKISREVKKVPAAGKGIKRKVWFNSYTDKELNTHEPSIVHYEE